MSGQKKTAEKGNGMDSSVSSPLILDADVEFLDGLKADPQAKLIPPAVFSEEKDAAVAIAHNASMSACHGSCREGEVDLLPQELRNRARVTEDEMVHLVELDQEFMSDQRAAWTERWNRIVAGG